MRRAILRELTEIAERAAEGIVGAVDRAIQRRQAHPAFWYAFHRRVLARLPKWRRLAKAWHRMRARRYESMALAMQSLGNPVACALCEAAEGGGS